MKSIVLSALLCVLTAPFLGHPQDKITIKINKVLPQDFNLSGKKINFSVSAVVIANVGTSASEGNSKSGMSSIFTKRIKILNKSDNEAATLEIPLYAIRSDEAKLQNLKV